MHDVRVGRFFAVDPLAPKYPYYTPYQYAGNKVIAWGELEGLEEKFDILYGYSKATDEGKKAWLDSQEKVFSNVLRYVTPAEEVYGFFTGKDFDNKDYNRAQTIIFLVPFLKLGKLAKPLIKVKKLSAASKAVKIEKTAVKISKVYSLIERTKLYNKVNAIKTST
jgi:hypothetical protein